MNDFNVNKFLNNLKSMIEKREIKIPNEYLVSVRFTKIIFDLVYKLYKISNFIEVILIDNNISEI